MELRHKEYKEHMKQWVIYNLSEERRQVEEQLFYTLPYGWHIFEYAYVAEDGSNASTYY